ncbi:uncharacterized protein (TIGR02569 family) [Stackebrandtia albiflava]|uniref:Uncharacterized protein (TIGR02569 family) n=1 Tax=Stackebrandtia albiflava TaxID=406432 RepID=A0A562V2K6_9ACTN|nr:TIGR02569 family protein [Stackebrandtia albiflava]TWJ12073.1 uncharacterized protein (TIGR02569 family) [Stackebrandtia albiflava]
MTTPPPAEVLRAFDATGTARPVTGGQGVTWRADDVILKPTWNPAETRWRAGVLAELPDTADFRVARPVPATTGDGTDWVHGGWEGWHVARGREDPHRVDDAVATGLAFHAALRRIDRPGFLDLRDDPWSRADRIAWGEEPAPMADPLLDAILADCRPVRLPSQAVHPDLLGNLLYADGLPPAVIDWPPYWRPVEWAAAVAVVDARCWYDADTGVIDRWSRLPAWPQMLRRALAFRYATDLLRAPDGRASAESRRVHGDLATLLAARGG